MMSSGVGTHRRQHKKSHNGCDNCKRRHIRCDESFPQCRNCTRYHCKCPFALLPQRGDYQENAEFLANPELEFEAGIQQPSDVFSLPYEQDPLDVNPSDSSIEELYMIHFLSSVRPRTDNAGNFDTWKSQIPIFVRIAIANDFVMHALLALSSSHIAWLTNRPLVKEMTYEHRGKALHGLCEAIKVFSKENSDAVLAASLLLSWQEIDSTQMQLGTSAIIHAIQPWQNESQFRGFFEEHSASFAAEVDNVGV